MSEDIEVVGGSDPLVTAAIIAAVARLEEERLLLASIPPQRPSRGRWELSGRSREVVPPSVRVQPMTGAWSVAAEDSEDV
jgi:hypothetical protein